MEKQDRYALLEKEVILMNEMVTELQGIVRQQGDIVDSIEDHISTTRQDVTKGHLHVEETQISYMYPMIGVGIGALYLFHPYMALGTICIALAVKVHTL